MMASTQQEFDPGTPDHIREDFMRASSGGRTRKRKREEKRKDHVCKNRSAWLSMKNTGICHVEQRGSRAYLSVCYHAGGEIKTRLVRIHHCPFCGVKLDRQPKRKIPAAPTGLHARLLREQ
jgi:hypothetical protein